MMSIMLLIAIYLDAFSPGATPDDFIAMAAFP
ncbi:hypothetical protein ACVIHI_008954 [Bradyrhizobium sp. USDA 4524]|nr:hypothetical protein [Bradyrhizobium sp. USDA 4537]MCP1985574.1 hypothetical protein [Bradyrhizobium sp. USDA 4539]